METSVNRGRGRPAGSKNKVKTVQPSNTEKRGRGRPKGSTNKEKETLYTFRSSKCTCVVKSGIKSAEITCGKHHNALTIDGK